MSHPLRIIPIVLWVIAAHVALTATADPLTFNPEQHAKRLAALREQAKVRRDPNVLLDTVAADFRFNRDRLDDALARVVGDQLLVDWRVLEAVGLKRDARVTWIARGETNRESVRAILAAAGADAKGVRVDTADELVIVSNDEGVRRILRWLQAGHDRMDAPGSGSPLVARIAAVELCACLGEQFGLSVSPTVRDAIDGVAREAGVAIRVNWAALERHGIEPDAPLHDTLPNVSIRSALAVLFAPFDQFDTLALRVEGDAIVIDAK